MDSNSSVSAQWVNLPHEEMVILANERLIENPNHEQVVLVQKLRNHSESAKAKDGENAAWKAKHAKLEAALKAKDGENAAWKAKHAKLEAALEKRSLQSILSYFPAVPDISASGAHMPNARINPAAEVTDDPLTKKELSLVDKLLTPEFLAAPFLPYNGQDECQSESQVLACLVHPLLVSIITALGLSNVVGTALNRSLAGSECDILLVYKPNKLPFATIEVKKPGSTAKSRNEVIFGVDPSKPITVGTRKPLGRKAKVGKAYGRDSGRYGNLVAGQVFNQMMAIKLFGFQTVHGMITTGNNWRLVSTGESSNIDHHLSAKSIAEMTDTLRNQMVSVGNTIQQGDTCSPDVRPDVDDQVAQPEEISCVERVIYASQIVPNLLKSDQEMDEQMLHALQKSGRQILQLITIFILQSCRSLIHLLRKNGGHRNSIVIHQKMPCRMLQGTSKFSFGVAKVSMMHFSNFEKEDPGKISVVQHLGWGESGNCCLGMSKQGKSWCAIKFFHNQNDSQHEANEEYQNWKHVYGKQKILPMCYVRNLYMRHFCLVMPYLHPIKSTDRQRMLDQGQIKKALHSFASTNCTHGDIKWRHFGTWNDQVFLIDLGHIETDQDSDEIETWCEESLKYLKRTTGTVQTELNEATFLTPAPQRLGKKRALDLTSSTRVLRSSNGRTKPV